MLLLIFAGTFEPLGFILSSILVGIPLLNFLLLRLIPGDAVDVLVTSWDNLSLYYQDSSWRKQAVDNPKRSRVEDYNSRNEGYVIEQIEKIALTENVELLP